MHYSKLTLIFTLALSITLSGCSFDAQNQEKQVEKEPKQEEQEKTEEKISISTEQEIKIITSDIDISDWQTYRNKEYGYEIKYPGKNKVAEYTNKIDFLVEDKKYFSFEIIDNFEKLEAKEWLDDKWMEYSGKWPGYYEDRLVNGRKATLAILDNRTLSDPYKCYMENIIFSKNKMFYVFYLNELCNSTEDKKDENNDLIELFEKIVSSFELID